MKAGNKKTILVVDDVAGNIAILEEILREEYRVKAATGGEAALRIARSDSPPDLILLDVAMPGMDGFEVCRRLKEDGAGASIPVIFLTSKDKAADETIGFEVGAVDYLTKPVNPDTVKTRVKAHLELREEALRVSEIRFRRLFETAKDGILILDAETGRILDANPSLIGMLGYSHEALLGKHVWELESLKDIAADKDRLLDLREREYTGYKRVPLGTPDGRRIDVEFVSNAYLVNQRSVIQFNLRDITVQVAAERQKQEFSERLHHYLATSPTITYSFRIEGGRSVWQWVSENVERILGYSPAEALLPDWWLSRVHPDDRKDVIYGLPELVRKDVLTREYRFTTKDRRSIWLRDELRILRGEDGSTEVVGTLTDVSAGRKAEAELALKSAALEAAANAMLITDREGRLIWLNSAFSRLSGYSLEEAIGKNPRDLVKSTMHDEGFYRAMWETILAGMVWNGTIVNRRKSGETYSEEMTITPIPDKAGRIANFVAIKSDVTERESAALRLEASNREKDLLLQEVHHRVNNNMQIISSLFHLSSRKGDDPGDRGGMGRRINTMALIHQQFCESEDISRIDFSKSLRGIVDEIREEWPATARRVAVAYAAEEALLGIEMAIPAGLIVAELVANAFGHAFSDLAREGSLRIRLGAVENGTLEIEVRDDGAGLPQGFDPSIAETLGMVLIMSLSKQLRGEVSFSREGGTSACLRFPLRSRDASFIPVSPEPKEQ
ncbi:MAG: PAS domain S-box protein [Rectinemataceae bacterium]